MSFSVSSVLAPLEAIPTFPFLCIVVVLFAVVYAFQHRHGNAIGTNPRPDLWEPEGSRFLLGHLPVALKHKGRFLELWARWKDECPSDRTLSITIPFRRLVDCSQPDSLEHIQKTNFSNFQKGKTMRDRLSILGNGIFAVDGDTWHQQRKVTSKVFTPTLFRTAISASVHSNLARFASILEKHADREESFDLGDLFFRYTLSAFADFSFSTDVGALPPVDVDKTAPVPFASAFDKAQVLIEGRFTNPLWKLTERFTGTTKAMSDAKQVIDDFVYGIIDRRQAEGKNDLTKEDKKEAANTDLLSLYLALEDEKGEKLSKENIRDASLSLLLAGRDTTAEVLSWCCYHLFAPGNEEHYQKMRAEVDELGEVTYDNHKSFTYLTAVFLEALRLHPSVPRNGWETLRDDQLPNGVRLEAGDCTFWSDWAMGRDEGIWGEDAKMFKPSRWIDDAGELIKESQWKAHFFNGGARICLGQTLATLEAVSALALIARDFDFRLSDSFYEETSFIDEGKKEQQPRYKGALTLFMESPLTVQVSRRKTAV